jgi:hypothetical protein
MMFAMHNSTINKRAFREDEYSTDVSDIIDALFQKGLLVELILWLLLYLGIAFAWLFILIQYPIDEIQSGNVSTSMDSIGGVFVFIYIYIWLNDAAGGYADGPKKLRSMLFSEKNIGMEISSFIDINNKKKSSITVQDVNCIRVKIATLMIGTYRLFIPNFYPRSNPDIEANIQYELNAHSDKYQHKIDAIKLLSSILIEYNIWLCNLLESKYITESQLFYIKELLKEIHQEIKEADTLINVKTTYVFKGHLIFSLYVYFFVWIPLAIFPYMSFTLFIVVYCTLMLILTGPIIYRRWLKDPFHPNSPIIHNNYYGWYRDFTDEFDSQCKSLLK